MRICISGASGLVGSTLTPQLEAAGHKVDRLVRTKGGDGIAWDPAAGHIDAAKLEGVEAVVHLAGENIGEGRWTTAKKARILDSRVQGTSLLCQTLAGLEQKPRTLVSASAIGYYGDRGDKRLDESAEAGTGFLPEVCQAWEEATAAAAEAGIRVVRLRIGVVLSPDGGALAKMLLPFKLGAGGKVGSGRQYMSWIALHDLARTIAHVIDDSSLAGPVNAVAPQPVTNLEFTKALGRVLKRPTVIPMPAAAIRLALGQMADDLLLASARVVPTRLEASGFAWETPEIETALRRLLSRTG